MNVARQEPRRPGPLARYGPIALVGSLLAAVIVMLSVSDPPKATTGAVSTAPSGIGAGTLADINDYPEGVMPLKKAEAEGTVDKYTWGERCDRKTGYLALPLSPPPDCFAEFTGDNGGATGPGVTGDSIKVVVYTEKRDDPLLKFIYGQIGLSTKPGDTEKTYRMISEVFSHYYETYGRKVEIVPYEPTGGIQDAVAAAADAETIARDIKPFAVLGGPQLTNAFGDTLAANHVLCIGCAENQPNPWMVARAPYVWSVQKSLDQDLLMVVEYMKKRLAGRDAVYAGDPAMHNKKRVFGIIHVSSAEQTSQIKELVKQMKTAGVDVAAVQGYLNPLTLNAEGRDILTDFKAKGVTSILLITDPVAPQALTRVATTQKYFPEWITSGQTLMESTVFARSYDQQQWAHAFGPSNRFPYTRSGIGSPLYLFAWYYGSPPPAQAATLLLSPHLQVLYAALQGMGPDVTAENFRKVLFRAPIIPGSSIAPRISFGDRGTFPWPDYTVVDDQSEIWWSSDQVGPAESGKMGKGVWMYANEGHRYIPGQWPEGQPKLTADTSIYSPEKVPKDAFQPGDYAPISGPRKGQKLSR